MEPWGTPCVSQAAADLYGLRETFLPDSENLSQPPQCSYNETRRESLCAEWIGSMWMQTTQVCLFVLQVVNMTSLGPPPSAAPERRSMGNVCRSTVTVGMVWERPRAKITPTRSTARSPATGRRTSVSFTQLQHSWISEALSIRCRSESMWDLSRTPP